jgi:hypothetical protein
VRWYVIVAAYAQCSTVVLVTLDDDDMECKPDLLWTPMDQSGLLCTGFQIGNTDWGEAKEGDLRGPQWFQPGPGIPPERLEDDHGPSETTPVQDYSTLPVVGFHVQLYIVDGVDGNQLLYDLQPRLESQRLDVKQHAYRLRSISSSAKEQPARKAAKMHPSICARHPSVQKNYFIIADSPNHAKDGVGIVKIDRDGDVDGKTVDELLAVREEAGIEQQRAEASTMPSGKAVGTTLMLAQGYQKWAVKHKVVAVYSDEYPDGSISVSVAIDPRWANRGHGQDRVVFGGYLRTSEQGEQFWQNLLEKHVACCTARRFVPNFGPDYLIWCGEKGATAESDVLLVRLEREDSGQSGTAMLSNAMPAISQWQVVAKDAHSTLTKVLEGTKAWGGSDV